MPMLSSLFPSPLLLCVRHNFMGWYHPHLGWIFLSWVKPLWKYHHRYTQGCVSQVIFHPVKLFMKIHHNSGDPRVRNKERPSLFPASSLSGHKALVIIPPLASLAPRDQRNVLEEYFGKFHQFQNSDFFKGVPLRDRKKLPFPRSEGWDSSYGEGKQAHVWEYCYHSVSVEDFPRIPHGAKVYRCSGTLYTRMWYLHITCIQPLIHLKSSQDYM